ncbi:MAG: hypothetical protein J5938_06465 [Clostridia bacterium]|nr:hypothetical protein [Clostridia bacterium]
MKRAFLLIGAALVGVLSLFLFSCGKSFSLVGEWEMESCELNGKPLSEMDPCIFRFWEDGTGEKEILGEIQLTFSYSYDGNTCVLFGIRYADGETDAGSCGDVTVLDRDRISIRATENDTVEVITLKRKGT